MKLTKFALGCLQAPGLVFILIVSSAPMSASDFAQTNLVSDVSGTAATTDAKLVNPWGLAASPSGPWWVANQGTSVVTVYSGVGQPLPVVSPLIVGVGTPTGAIYNPTSDFSLSLSGQTVPSQFIFASENGRIFGWSAAVATESAVMLADQSLNGAIYTGLAIAASSAGNRLYVANFSGGRIDAFDSTLQLVPMATGAFVDAGLPAGYAPFNIRNIGGLLYVTYALQSADRHDNVPGAGNGYVDIFNADGAFLQRLISRGELNSPWGMVVAPASFGAFANALLVGNFGDGRINAFSLTNGQNLGPVTDTLGNPLVNAGLRSLEFGNDGDAGAAGTLFFTAGIQNETHGLLGRVAPATEPIMSVSVTPKVVTVGEPIYFQVVYRISVVPLWSFGDGTTYIGTGGAHTYTAPGTYNVVVVLTTAGGNSTASTVQVQVNPLPIPTIPYNPGPTPPPEPTSTPHQKAAPQLSLYVGNLQIRLNFAAAGRDTATLAGVLHTLNGGPNMTSSNLVVSIGDASQSFQLRKGVGRSGRSTAKVKTPRGQNQSTFTIKLNGSLASGLAAYGLTDSSISGLPVEVPVTLDFNGSTFQTTATATYSAKAGRSGKATNRQH